MPRAARPASAVRVPQDRTATQSWASSPAVRTRMQRQQTRDTQPELAVRRLLHAAGLRYRVDEPPVRTLRRRADVVFGPAKVALFVDGCFWHGCPDHGARPTHSNNAYWTDKIRRNRERDHQTDAELESAGWISIRVWEHEDARDVADRVILVVKSRRVSIAHGDASDRHKPGLSGEQGSPSAKVPPMEPQQLDASGFPICDDTTLGIV